MATSAPPDRTGLGSAPDIDNAPPRLAPHEDTSDESGGEGDEGLVGLTFPGAVSAASGATDGSPDWGTARLVTTNDERGSAGGVMEDSCPIFNVASANAGNVDLVDALQDLHSADTDESEDTLFDADPSVEAFFHHYEVSHDMVLKGVADTLDIPEEQAQIVVDMNIFWPGSVDNVLEGVKDGDVSRRQKERLVLGDSRKTFDFGQASDGQLRSLVLGAKLLAAYVKAALMDGIEPCPKKLKNTLRAKWDAPCSLQDITMILAGATQTGSYASSLKETLARLSSRGDRFPFRVKHQLTKLAEAGCTNGAAICLRGRNISYGRKTVPFLLSIPGDVDERPGTLPMEFWLVDRTVSAEREHRKAVSGAAPATRLGDSRPNTIGAGSSGTTRAVTSTGSGFLLWTPDM